MFTFSKFLIKKIMITFFFIIYSYFKSVSGSKNTLNV